ncbi:hypothetical protein BC835DRAFT_1314816 [Cytidiella melzeri]|nr:hypothetical protein BC835DRAFT_1314816 [Cytidiella melzeri]
MHCFPSHHPGYSNSHSHGSFLVQSQCAQCDFLVAPCCLCGDAGPDCAKPKQTHEPPRGTP